MHPRKFWALTISPPMRTYRNARFIYEDDMFLIRSLLNRCSEHWTLVPEFSKDSRLHYHGVVRIDDCVKWHKQTRQSLNKLGFVKLDPLLDNKNHVAWLCYIYKQYHITSLVLNLTEPPRYNRPKRRKHTEVENIIVLPGGKKCKSIMDYI